jgi:uncharacterized membrane protein YqjE
VASASEHGGRVVGLLRSIARRLLIIGGNRVELLAVEAQEERTLLLESLFMALVAVGFGLLAGGAFTASVVLLLWTYPHAAVLLALCACYLVIGALVWWRLQARLAQWRMFSSTVGQLRKDRERLEEVFR